MRRLWMLLTLCAGLAISAAAQTTPNLHMNIPTTGTQNWGPIMNYNFSLLDTKLACFGTAATAGTITYFNGTSWLCLTGNSGSAGLLAESSAGAPAWSPQYTKLRCEPGLGDGLNAIAAGTYLQSTCYNDSGVTWTITGIRCFTDNAGASTLNATNGAGTALLTGTITCGTAFTAGTQSATVTIASTDFVKFTFVADGTSKQTTWVVSFTQ